MAEAKVTDRPLRADAQRNRQRLIDVARATFASDKPGALECIAREAGVGIGTLYRHFPTRLDLLVAIYREDIDGLVDRSKDTSLSAWDSFVAYVDGFVEFGTTKRALMDELRDNVGGDSEVFTKCRTDLVDSAEHVLRRAQEAGVVRADVDPRDLIRMLGGVVMSPLSEPAQARRILGVILDGLKV